MGKHLFEYIRSLRLSKAARILRDHKVKVIDVALDFVFDSHEGFTRAFSREFGVSPYQYSKNTPPIRLFIPQPVMDIYYFKEGQKMKAEIQRQTIFTQVIERPERKLVFKRAKTANNYFEYCQEIGCDIWGVLCSIKEALYEPAGFWLPETLRPAGVSKYVQGVEVPFNDVSSLSEGLEIMVLPPCRMMVFQGPSYADEDFCQAIANVSQAIESYQPELYGFEWADKDAPRFQLEPQGYRGYIEARPVKRLKR